MAISAIYKLRAGQIYDMAIVAGDFFIGGYIGRMMHPLLIPDKKGDWLQVPDMISDRLGIIYLAAFLLYLVGLFLYREPLKYIAPFKNEEYRWLPESEESRLFSFVVLISIIYGIFLCYISTNLLTKYFGVYEFSIFLDITSVAMFAVVLFSMIFLLNRMLMLVGKKHGEKEPKNSMWQKFIGLILTYPTAILILVPFNVYIEGFHIPIDEYPHSVYRLVVADLIGALSFATLAWMFIYPFRRIASLPVGRGISELTFFISFVASYCIKMVW